MRQSSAAALVHQARAVDAAVGDAAGPNQHAVSGSTGEVTAARYRAVVPAFGAAELQSEPESRGKVRRAQVTDERHLVGAAEQNLHADSETDLSVRDGRWAGPRRAAGKSSAEGAPAPTLRVGTAPVFSIRMQQRNDL